MVEFILELRRRINFGEFVKLLKIEAVMQRVLCWLSKKKKWNLIAYENDA